MKEKILSAKIKIYAWEELSNEDKRLVEEAKNASKKAYAPYSHFQVGAAVLLESGKLLSGSNQENGAYTAGLCAERTVLNYATAQYPNDPVVAISIVASDHLGNWTAQPCTPCGECRQVLKEVELRGQKPLRILMIGENEIWEAEGIETLLPLGFELNK